MSRLGAFARGFAAGVKGQTITDEGDLARCQFCRGTKFRTTTKFTTGGILTLLFGIIMTPILIGLFLIMWALTMRETVTTCKSCGKRV